MTDLEAASVRQPHAPVRYVVRELLETAVFILLVFLIVRGVVQNFKIEGSSMEPTLHTGQYILVNKLIYFHFDLNAPLRLLPGQADLPPRIVYPFRQPQRGDIVVFEYPRDVRKDYIKRVIGLPGAGRSRGFPREACTSTESVSMNRTCTALQRTALAGIAVPRDRSLFRLEVFL
jgi:Signal peptidase I